MAGYATSVDRLVVLVGVCSTLVAGSAEAEASYRAVINADPQNSNAYHHLGWLLHSRGQLQESEGVYRMAATIAPSHAGIQDSLGSLLYQRGALAEAEQQYRLVLHQVPTRYQAHQKLSQILVKRKNYTEAWASYQDFLQLAPDKEDALLVGDIFYVHGRLLEAEASFRQALFLEPGNVKVLARIGKLAQDSQNMSQRKNVFTEKVLGTNSDFVTELLASHQLQSIAKHLGAPQPPRRSLGQHFFQRVELQFRREGFNEAYSCMARHCFALLTACNTDDNCTGRLVFQMNREPPDCADGEDQEQPVLLRQLLECYARECPPNTNKQWRRMPQVFSSEEVQQILALKDVAIQEAMDSGLNKSEVHKFRSFGKYNDSRVANLTDEQMREQGAGHLVTVIHRVISLHQPNILERLKNSAVIADADGNWGVGANAYNRASLLNVRSAEIIEYNATAPESWNMYGLGSHRDHGSLLTVSVALQGPDEFDGGELLFFSHCTNVSVVPKPSKGDVTVWPSWIRHGATPVRRGHRYILVLELWEFCTRPSNRTVMRPSPDDAEILSDCIHDDGEASAPCGAETCRAAM